MKIGAKRTHTQILISYARLGLLALQMPNITPNVFVLISSMQTLLSRNSFRIVFECNHLFHLKGHLKKKYLIKKKKKKRKEELKCLYSNHLYVFERQKMTRGNISKKYKHCPV